MLAFKMQLNRIYTTTSPRIIASSLLAGLLAAQLALPAQGAEDVSSDPTSESPIESPVEPTPDNQTTGTDETDTEIPDAEATPGPDTVIGADIDPNADPNSDPDADPMLLNPFNAPFSQQNFVPDISLILDTSVGGRNLSNEDFAGLSQPLSLRGSGEAHHLMNAGNGFNLNYAELTMASAIDPFFDLFAVFHLSPSEIEIEEAYFSTRGLPANLQFKAGKFLSHFGRLNSQHAHFWSFSDAPAIYSAFFGNEHLNELGARLSWLAPVDFYLDLGLELLQGTNEGSFGTAGFSVGDRNLTAIQLPNLAVATLKSSVDLREDLVLLGGLSFAAGGTRISPESAHAHEEEHEEDEEAHEEEHADADEHAAGALEYYAGGSQILGADLSLRWFPDSYTELTWQSEFLFRYSSGEQFAATGPSPLTLYQSGLYSQLIWRFAQQWRTGVRLDLGTFNRRVSAGSASDGPSLMPRYTAMLEFTPSEFSRFRLQYSLDQSQLLAEQQQAIHSLFLQVNLAMGAHGAHLF